MTELTDEIIMNRVKEGELSEMAVLFERYHVRLFNFFLKLTFNKTISHDLTQNLFYRIMKYRHTYDKECDFRAWIYKLARNVHIDHCREQQREKSRFTRMEDINETLIECEENYNENNYSKLNRALSKLEPDQREVIVLSRFQGLKYEEISKLRGTTVGAIKVQVHRAMKQLRELYFKQN